MAEQAISHRPRVGVYPGTFDPITKGHLDIIRRGAKLVDRLVVGVATNPSKSPMFTLEERVAQVQREAAKVASNVDVVAFNSLLMKFAESQSADIIIRGLRAVSDFEYEFQMAGMNRYLLPDVETLFLTPSDQYQFISGTIVREIATLGGDVSKFVFPSVERWLKEKIAKGNV